MNPPREHLNLGLLQDAAGPSWQITLLPTAGSTNEIAALAPVPGRVVIAEHQVAGRGRLDRTWSSPPGTSLTFSAVVAPVLAAAHWQLLPLAAGMAVHEALRDLGAEPVLKWPNDVLLESGKVCGVLVERVIGPPAAVIGIGINIDMTEAELPVPTASALSVEGVMVSRTEAFGHVLHRLREEIGQLEADPSLWRDAYRAVCGTIGREVEAHLPGGNRLRGRAVGIDDSGQLEIDVAGHIATVAAGDVVHLRPVE